jgi:hypothetical protein
MSQDLVVLTMHGHTVENLRLQIQLLDQVGSAIVLVTLFCPLFCVAS